MVAEVVSRLPLECGLHYTIEPATVDELALIIDSWCAGQAGQPHYALVPPEIFKVEMRARVTRLLGTSRCAVARPTPLGWDVLGVAPVNRDTRSILGWVCYAYDKATQAPIIHFLYVKARYREQGVATGLATKAAGVSRDNLWWSTHTTPRIGKLLRRCGGTWNPFLLEYVDQAHSLRRVK